MTAAATVVVVRLPFQVDDGWAQQVGHEMRAMLDRLSMLPRLALLRVEASAPPVVLDITHDGSIGNVGIPGDLIGRVRRLELEAMLRHNNGIWKPPDYHFRLPSGAHGQCFVRVADSIRTPRDAIVLASWLLPFVTEDTGLLLDSASLVSVATALDALAARNGISLGPTVSLEEYPKNTLDTMKAVRDVDRGSNVVAVLSVHSTGSLLNRLTHALNQVATKQWTLQVLVDKAGERGGSAFAVPDDSATVLERTAVWAHLGEAADVQPDDCRACRHGPARIAQIDPRTFDGMVLPTPEFLTPSAIWAFEQRQFWELVDAADAVTLEAPSDVSGLHPRYGTDKFMSVKVNFGDLLAGDHSELLAAACRQRIEDLAARGRLHPPYGVMVVDERESSLPNFDAVASAVEEALGIERRVVPTDGSFDAPSQDALKSADRHLILRLGLVSGLSLQQCLYEIQQVRRGTDRYDIDALVVHLRPPDGRVRETLQNSLARRLTFLWESYLPEDRHPLQEEHEIIGGLTGTYTDHVENFLQHRLAICSGFSNDDQILWGAGPHLGDDASRLSPMSYFGEALRVRPAYAAIGAAVHHVRIAASSPRSAPLWRMFEMPAILRSYYDPIIICCVLRWLSSTEIWWGEDDRSALATLTNAVRRTGDRERPMLVAELLLAAAQAKVPAALRPFLLTEGEVLANHVGAPNDAPLQLGIVAVNSMA